MVDVVGPALVSTSPAFVRSSASPHVRLTKKGKSGPHCWGREGSICDRCDSSTACMLCRLEPPPDVITSFHKIDIINASHEPVIQTGKLNNSFFHCLFLEYESLAYVSALHMMQCSGSTSLFPLFGWALVFLLLEHSILRVLFLEKGAKRDRRHRKKRECSTQWRLPSWKCCGI